MSTYVTPCHPLLAQVRRMPLVAILRGLTPQDALAIGTAIVECGFTALEVPLNRPGALECIEILTHAMPADVLVGGGTMLTTGDVDSVRSAGGRLMVSPNFDAEVISHAVGLGMLCAPGVATPSEAFGALKAGAQILKLFPSDMVGAGGLKALKSVLPAGTDVLPVGGITPESMQNWVKAGATGFGIGSQLYAPGTSQEEVCKRACAYVQAWRESVRAT